MDKILALLTVMVINQSPVMAQVPPDVVVMRNAIETTRDDLAKDLMAIKKAVEALSDKSRESLASVPLGSAIVDTHKGLVLMMLDLDVLSVCTGGTSYFNDVDMNLVNYLVTGKEESK